MDIQLTGWQFWIALAIAMLFSGSTGGLVSWRLKDWQEERSTNRQIRKQQREAEIKRAGETAQALSTFHQALREAESGSHYRDLIQSAAYKGISRVASEGGLVSSSAEEVTAALRKLGRMPEVIRSPDRGTIVQVKRQGISFVDRQPGRSIQDVEAEYLLAKQELLGKLEVDRDKWLAIRDGSKESARG